MIGSTQRDVSVVIVTWNSSGEILGCLSSLFEHADGLDLEVFVIDNASQDDTATILRHEFPRVKLIVNRANVGFASATNTGIALASAPSILLLNPDTIVQPWALAALARHLHDHPRAAAVAPSLVLPNGERQRSCTRFPSIGTIVRGFLRRGGYLPSNMKRPSRVQAVSGAALLLQREAVTKIGLLDTRYFMYGEDTDWCYRADQAGWEIHYLPTATIVHLRGQSAKRVPVDTYVRRRSSKLLFVKKHRSPLEFRVLRRLMRLHIDVRRLLTTGARSQYYARVLAKFDSDVPDSG